MFLCNRNIGCYGHVMYMLCYGDYWRYFLNKNKNISKSAKLNDQTLQYAATGQ